jgi:uncharacterized protein
MLPLLPPAKLQYGEPEHQFDLEPAQVDTWFDDPLYQDLIASPAFQRLKHVRFLGAIDYVVHPNGRRPNVRYTRYQHSLGVGLLAKRFAKALCLPRRDERLVVAALLHDIGHAPLSHSLEPVFAKYFEVDHHKATVEIISGRTSSSAGIPGILRFRGLSSDTVIELLSAPGGPFASLFHGPFNLDTLDAISRCANYLQRHSLDAPPYVVMEAAHLSNSAERDVLDAFWRLKHLVYSSLINGHVGVLADNNAQRYMLRNLSGFSRDLFYVTEDRLKDLHPFLFKRLDLVLVDRIESHRRHFVIESSESEISKRYLTRRETVVLSFSPARTIRTPEESTSSFLFPNES